MRIAIGQLWQESNTLNPLPTTLADFEAFGIHQGTELIERFAETNGLSVGSGLPLGTAGGETRFIVRGIMKETGLATAFGAIASMRVRTSRSDWDVVAPTADLRRAR